MKTILHLAALPLLLTLGCGGRTNDNADSGSSGSSGETGDTSVSSTLTASTTMTTMDSMSATGTTMTTTTESTTTSVTDTDPTTMDPDTTASGTDATTTTDATGSTGATTDPGTSTGGGAVAYGPCDFSDPNDPTCPEGEICLVVDFGQFVGTHWCGVPCEMGDASGCPASPNDTAIVECSGLGLCALDCGDGDCPDGMECNPIGSGDRCVWPAE